MRKLFFFFFFCKVLWYFLIFRAQFSSDKFMISQHHEKALCNYCKTHVILHVPLYKVLKRSRGFRSAGFIIPSHQMALLRAKFTLPSLHLAQGL